MLFPGTGDPLISYINDIPIKTSETIFRSTICKPKISKTVYSTYINTIALPPVAKLKWSINYEITDDDWHSIFRIPFCSVRDTAIQYFQYRILHRVLGLNSLLFKMKMTDSPKCSFCNTEDETIEHFF